MQQHGFERKGETESIKITKKQIYYDFNKHFLHIK